jgi:hypothetical protein
VIAVIDQLRFLTAEHILSLTMGICLFLIVFGTYINLCETHDLYQEDIRPFGIVGPNLSTTTYFVGIVMLENTNDAIFMINEWDLSNPPSNYTIHFSDPSTEVKFAIKRRNMNVSSNERILQFGEMRHIPYGDIPYYRNITLDEGMIQVIPSEIQNYFGLEAKIQNITRPVSPSELAISVPLNIQTGKMDLNETAQNIFIQIIPPKNYVISEALPEPNLYRLIRNNNVAYEFLVDSSVTDFFVLFENRFLSRHIQLFEIVLGMLLSLATYFIVNGFMQIANPIKQRIIRKEREPQLRDQEMTNTAPEANTEVQEESPVDPEDQLLLK